MPTTYRTPDERRAKRRNYMRGYMKRWRAMHRDRVLATRIRSAQNLLDRYYAQKGGGEHE